MRQMQSASPAQLAAAQAQMANMSPQQVQLPADAGCLFQKQSRTGVVGFLLGDLGVKENLHILCA